MRACPPLCLFLLVALTTAASAQPDRGRFWRWTYGDAAALFTEVDARTPLYGLGVAAALAPVSLLDEPITVALSSHRRGLFSRYLDVVNELGGPPVKVPVAALFVLSLGTRNTRFQDAAFTSLQALVYAGGLHYAVKYPVGRFRPNEGEGPYHFRPFTGNRSFPSGHTTTAFAILTPWALYYPGPLTYTLLAVGAGGTGLSRIVREKHWTTDVLTGGTLGFLTAAWLTRRHRQSTSSSASTGMSVTPILQPDAFTLMLTVRWP